MTTAVRLRPLVEVIDDGERLWLLRGPAGGDCRIAAPSGAVRQLVALLESGGGTADELSRGLAERGAATPPADVAVMLRSLDRAELLEPVTDERANDRLARQRLYLRDRRPRSADAGAMQSAISNARVAILGCGGLGSWAAAGLACIGIGGLTLIDGDVVEESNLNRQLLFRERDIGRSKVTAAAEALVAFNGSLAIAEVPRYVEEVDDLRRCLAGHDFVVACADRPAYEIARRVNTACALEDIPHLSAGQLAPIVRVGPTVIPGGSPCVGCLESSLRTETPLYDLLEASRRNDHRPQATLGPASGIVGQVIAMEILHHLSGIVRPATVGAVWTMDLRTLRAELRTVAFSEDCPACG